MDNYIFKMASKLVYQEICRRQQDGELKTFIGTEGYLVLLLDKLERVMKGDRTQQTLLDVATDALLALSFTVANVATVAAAEVEAEELAAEDTHLTEEEVRELELQDFETEDDVESAE